jgi:hypothetical protein
MPFRIEVIAGHHETKSGGGLTMHRRKGNTLGAAVC